MVDIEPWIKLLYTYGPFALLVFFIFVAEKKARVAMKEASTKVRGPLLIVYLSNWLVIFGLVGYAAFAWHDINLRQEPTIQGRFEHQLLTGTKNYMGILAFSSDNKLYLHPDYGPGASFDYDWRLITPQRLADATPLTFKFDWRICMSERTTRYVIKFRSSFYDDEVHIVYKQGTDKLFLKHRGKEEELAGRDGGLGGGKEERLAARDGGLGGGLIPAKAP